MNLLTCIGSSQHLTIVWAHNQSNSIDVIKRVSSVVKGVNAHSVAMNRYSIKVYNGVNTTWIIKYNS